MWRTNSFKQVAVFNVKIAIIFFLLTIFQFGGAFELHCVNNADWMIRKLINLMKGFIFDSLTFYSLTSLLSEKLLPLEWPENSLNIVYSVFSRENLTCKESVQSYIKHSLSSPIIRGWISGPVIMHRALTYKRTRTVSWTEYF